MPPSPKTPLLSVALGSGHRAGGEGAVQCLACPSNAPTRPDCSLSPLSLASLRLNAARCVSLLAVIKRDERSFPRQTALCSHQPIFCCQTAFARTFADFTPCLCHHILCSLLSCQTHIVLLPAPCFLSAS